ESSVSTSQLSPANQKLEAAHFAVGAEGVSKYIADLTERGVGAHRVQHGGHQILTALRGPGNLLEGGLVRDGIAGGPDLLEALHLLVDQVVVDLEELDRRLLVRLEGVDPDDQPLLGLDLLLEEE